MTERTITASCRFDCEIVIGPDASMETEEIRKIHDESIEMLILDKYKWVSISDFRNAAGQTIGEFLLDKHAKFAVALAEKE